MSAVDKFYEWYKETGKPEEDRRKTKKKYKRQYFTFVTEEAIHAFNEETDEYKKNRIFKKFIYNAITKLVENVYNTYKFVYIPGDFLDIQGDVVSYLVNKMHKIVRGRGKAYSYLTVTARNYLIIWNKAEYEKLKKTGDLQEVDIERDINSEMALTESQQRLQTFIDRWVDWYGKNLPNKFDSLRDIQIADSVLELFRIRENLEVFNKKSLYILIREQTGVKTHYITPVITKIKQDFAIQYEHYLKTDNLLPIE